MGGEAGDGLGTQAVGRPLGSARSPVQGNPSMVCGRLGSAGGTGGASFLILASLAFPLRLWEEAWSLIGSITSFSSAVSPRNP